jgi:hypothetical protein
VNSCIAPEGDGVCEKIIVGIAKVEALAERLMQRLSMTTKTQADAHSYFSVFVGQ